MYTSDIDWCPSLYLGHNKLDGNGERLAKAQERDSRAALRVSRWEEIQPETQESVSNETVDLESETGSSTSDQQTETIHKGDLPIDFFDEETFIKDNGKVLYYTGLPKGELLQSVFELVIPYPGQSRGYYWRSFIVTLMKLRLNLRHQDLAYRLDVSKSTISRRFQEMFDILTRS